MHHRYGLHQAQKHVLNQMRNPGMRWWFITHSDPEYQGASAEAFVIQPE